MKKLKIFVCIAMAMTMLWHSNSTVYAVTHTPGCGATLKEVRCGSLMSTVNAGYHTLYVTANGTKVMCGIRAEKHFHTVKCANSSCGAVYESNSVRTCIEIHSSCPSQTGMCQY